MAVLDRANALRDVIAEYEEEKSVEASRLDNLRLRRAKLELAREAFLEHGEAAEAERLRTEIREVDHHIRASEKRLAQIINQIDLYRRTLDRLTRGPLP
jgi:hypothetical protein